jgi:chromosomal replication initiation ATPase DnaA
MSKAIKIVLKTLYDFCKAHDYKHPHMLIAEELIADKSYPLTIRDIKLIVYREYNIDEHTGDSKLRKREVVQARQIAHYIAKMVSESRGMHWSLEKIGREIGKRNHATVLNSVKVVNNLMETNRHFNAHFQVTKNIVLTTLKPIKDVKNDSRDTPEDS